MEDVEPRRSLRLAKKRVTVGLQEMVPDPEVLPYYMAAVKSRYAGTRQNTQGVLPEVEKQQEGMVQEEAFMDEEGDMESGEEL